MTVERATRNVGWVFGLYLVRRLIRLGYLAAFARTLEEYGFGSYRFLLSLVGVFEVTSALGLNVFMVRRVNRGESNVREFISRCFGLDLVSAGFFSIVLVVIAPLTGYSPDVKLAWLIMALSIVPHAVIAMTYSVGAAHETLWISGVLENVTSLAEAGIGLVMLLLGYRLVTLCTLHVVLYSLYAVVFVVLTRTYVLRFGITFDWRAWVGYLRESWRFWVFSIEAILAMHLGVILLSAISGNAKVGFFAAALVLVEVIQAAANAFRDVVFPYMVRAYERSADELRQFQESWMRLLAAAAVPVGLLGTLLAEPVVGFIFGERYASSVLVLQILSWAVFPLFFEQIAVRVCWAAGHEMLPILGHGLLNVVRITASVWLILGFADQAALGLAWALVTSSFAGFGIYSLLIRRYIFMFDPFGPLLRTAAAAVAPVVLMITLDGRVNVFLLSLMVVAAFAIGVVAFRVFTAREFEILRRALASLRRRTGVETAVPAAEQDDLEP